MLAADRLPGPIYLELISEDDPRFLAEVVLPALGGSYGQLTSAAPSWLDRLRGHSRESQHLPPSTLRSRCWVARPNRWRYEELGADGRVGHVFGCDGVNRWSVVEGKRDTWRADNPHENNQLAGTAWQQIPNQPLRELLDPSLTLAAFRIEEAEPTTQPDQQVLRLSGRSRNADLIESALVSPWAAGCELEVDATSGLVVAATNLDSAGKIVRRHKVMHYDLTAPVSDELFRAPGG
jgi:hypothetical protein